MTRGRPRLPAAALLALVAANCGGPTPVGASPAAVRLVAERSVVDAGLAAALAKAFREETGEEVRVAPEAGDAIAAAARRGDADVAILEEGPALAASDAWDATADVLVRRDGATREAGAPPPRRDFVVALVRAAPDAARERARRFLAWLRGPRARAVVRAHRSEGRRAFFLPGEP